jgi:hypothetical protein
MQWVPGCSASEVNSYDFSKALQDAPLPAGEIVELLGKAHELLGKEEGKM